MITIAGMSMAVFIAVLLLTKKNKSEGDWVLVAWFVSILIQIFVYHAFVTDSLPRFAFLLGVERPLPMLQGVFLYWYVGAMTGQLPSNRKLLTLHFLPALAAYAYLVPFFLMPDEQKLLIYKNEGAGYETFETIKLWVIVLSGIAYIVWSVVLLARHKRRIQNRFSYEEKINLQWLQILTWGLGGIWLLIAWSDEILFAGITVFVFLIGFFGIRQARIFTHPEAEEEEKEKEKYAKSGLTKELSEKLYEGLVRLMRDETVYQKNDLSIYDLATRLDVHPNYLSQVINEREKMNFYDFVNRYRIQKFKELAANPKNRHLTLLALAYECGFNSKSSFNRYYKKATGRTPSDYFSAQAP